MKQLLSLFMLCTGFQALYSQDLPFDFEVRNETYVPLSNGTVLYDSNGYVNPDHRHPIGFTFDGHLRSYDTLYIHAALLNLVRGADDYTYFFDHVFANVIRSHNPPLSSTLMALEGTPPNRILKIEFNNFTVDEYPDPGTYTYQVWLYEGSNVVEYRYGPKQATPPDPIASDSVNIYIGEASETNNFIHLFSTKGHYSFPQLTEGYTSHINEFPAQGVVYRFSPKPIGITENALEDRIRIIEQARQVSIESEVALESVRVYSLSGKQVWESNKPGQQLKWPTEHLAPGIYILHLKTADGVLTKKIGR